MTKKQSETARKTVGVKYCGGCNPQFDRVEAFSHLQECFEGSIRWVPCDETDLDAVLVICGCQTACADTEAFGKQRFIWLKGQQPLDSVRQALEALLTMP